ncbi:hypothetical protein BT96DRAFT_1016583 [Gymnopus androsaceus JB14]|uniref:Uncharacterized protein n=1 Tax=Gymnopus androsaceus JB14 TaxID=1447944 RepID=A0A6A4I1W9_9AGAR|nr:hypothetical protein BT96DRAFT_1016583 [Gymnopus androsaceus JB14]
MPCTAQTLSSLEHPGAYQELRPTSIDTDNLIDRQVKQLVRLRLIEQLQNTLGYPSSSPSNSHSFNFNEQVVLDVFNWIAQCFALRPSDAIALAISTRPGLVTLHLCHDQEHPNVKSVIRASKMFLSTLRTVLASGPEDMTGASSAIGPFFRMVVNMAHLRIQTKLSRIGYTDGTPEDTAYHFTSLVTTWLLFRPEGEQSRGFLTMAATYGGDVGRANEYMVQSFLTMVEQHNANAQCEKMNQDERFTYLSSIITACNLLINSTFFYDFLNYESFRMTLRVQDRIFLQKILRRLTYIASYKTGAAKFSFLGIPFLRQVLGEAGVANFADGKGGVQVELATENLLASATPTVLMKSYKWPSQAPAEYLPSMFNVSLDETPSTSPCHSRNTSGCSVETSSTDSSSFTRAELSKLDNQLRYELLHSQVVSEAWTPDLPVQTRCHPELQLIHYLEHQGLEVAYQAIGMSKPTCWACSKYVECLNLETAKRLENDLGEGESMQTPRWVLRNCVGKVRYDWMIPPMAKEEIVDAVVEDTQNKLERVVHEAVLDFCI